MNRELAAPPLAVTRHPVTAVVLALDEEALIGRCVSALLWADEVLVIDSGSVDRTVAVAEARGARVVHQAWLGFSRQRNAGAAAAVHDWVMFIDADEVVTPALRMAVERALQDPDPRDGYVFDRRDEFMGRLLPQAQTRSRRTRAFVRLYNRTRSRWDERFVVHEQVEITGKRHLLAGHLLQWRPQSLGEQVERVVRYSALEAEALPPMSHRRRAARLVMLPLARFSWLYVVRGEWRLGEVGLIHASLRASADFLRHARVVDRTRVETPAHPQGFEG